ncbi:MAG: hypothetical protein M3Z32_07855, partial [Acidobacteriota bacterium]|nr:hypothetical protein [Acidobacteriota bacterium]
MDLNKAGLACAAALCLTGCGYIGEPMYPALNIPKATVDLTAVERGNNLDVNFTVPALTTEGLIVKQIGGVELRIGPNPSAPFDVGNWSNAALKIEVPAPEKAGPVHVSVPVQPSFIGQDMVVGVRTIGAKGRASDWSNLVTLRVEPPLGTPADFSPSLNEKGVLLTWKAPGAASFRILRKAPGEPKPTPLATAAGPQYLDTTAEYG